MLKKLNPEDPSTGLKGVSTIFSVAKPEYWHYKSLKPVFVYNAIHQQSMSPTLLKDKCSGAAKLIAKLHPDDQQGVQVLISWLRKALDALLATVSLDFCISIEIRYCENDHWVRRFLMLEPSKADEQTCVYVWLMPEADENKFSDITLREKEVLQLVASGYSNKQIADKLCISIHTAINHRKHLISKFRVKNTAEMIREAGKLQLV